MEDELSELETKITNIENLLRIANQRISRLEEWRALQINKDVYETGFSLNNPPPPSENRAMGKTIGEISITNYPWLSNDDERE